MSADTAYTVACTRTEAERLAVSNDTRRYATWVHAAYSRGYDGVSAALCGKRFSDPYPDARGADAWEAVTCRSCRKAIDKAAKADELRQQAQQRRERARPSAGTWPRRAS